MMFVGVTATAVNHTNTGKAGPDGFQQELSKNEARVLKIQTV